MSPTPAAIAQRLAEAWHAGRALDAAELRVPDAAGAAAVQRALWQRLAPAQAAPAAWKVGAAGPDAAITSAPLPAVRPGGSTLSGPVFQRRGIELELALRLARDIDDPERLARAGSAAACIASVHAALEVVESRIAGWPEVPALAKLADLQSHGTLVLGDAAAWRPADGLPRLQQLAATLDVDGTRAADTVGGHPAPDLCRLLAALARQAADQGWPLRAGTVITTGSCTGMVFVGPQAQVSGRLSIAPAVSLSFAH
jgi:2-keto-4-pentenoate hydratase